MADTAEPGDSEGSGHRITLTADNWFPRRVPAGHLVRVRVRAACNRGCDLAGAAVTLRGPRGAAVESVLAPGGGGFVTESLAVSAPATLGTHRYSVVVGGPRRDGGPHLASEDLPRFETEAHMTSVAVWAVPSLVVTGEAVEVMVGVRCAEACDLAGARVEVADAGGETLVRGELGEVVWEGSKALYWTRAEVTAPDEDGRASWEARLPSTRLAATHLPHAPSAASFGTMVASPPPHRLSVGVFEAGTGLPIHGAAVSLGIYRGRTDHTGRTLVGVGAGTYDLIVWKPGYDAPSTTVSVSEDLALRIEAEPLPDTSEWEDD